MKVHLYTCSVTCVTSRSVLRSACRSAISTQLLDACTLQAMKEAKTGIYCGPLRLLAMEVFDSVNQEVCHPQTALQL